jgi:ribosomal protein S10
MDGRQIRSVKVEKNTPDQFEMSGLERGMYLIKFTTEAGKFSVKKLIVE